MAGEWYVEREGNRRGPYTDADLKRLAIDGLIQPTDQVWKNGMQEWHSAGDVRGLFVDARQGVAIPPKTQGDATGGIIPYKNPKALIAYYTGLFLSPCCLGFIPLIFGILALQDRAKNPEIKGAVHAYIGIVLGGISTLVLILGMIGFALKLMGVI